MYIEEGDLGESGMLVRWVDCEWIALYVFHLQYLLGLLGCYYFDLLCNQIMVFQGFEYFPIYSFRASFI